MYFSIYPSSEYYSDEDLDNNDDNNIIVDDNDICIICWLPGEKNNIIKHLSDFSHIISTCKCRPKIHRECVEKWITKSLSCPICRTKIKINLFETNQKNLYMYCCIIFVETTNKVLKLLCYASFVNMLAILIYNVYYIYFLNHFFQENHDMY